MRESFVTFRRMARMSLIVILGQIDVHPEDIAAVAELMRVMMNQTVKEQGCHLYAFSRDLSTANRFQLSELWEDEAALAAHFRTEHMATYRQGLSRLRVQKRTVKRYEVTNARDL
jgi:quinol monooxygenase YgiN